MKNNQLTLILVILFFLTTLATGLLVLRYNSSIHKTQDAQGRAKNAVILGKVFNQLIGETAEYGKKNPAVEPILQSLTNQAAAKATTK
jgi:preprotein translocase subunit SecG